jgi:hypothetical protein
MEDLEIFSYGIVEYKHFSSFMGVTQGDPAFSRI